MKESRFFYVPDAAHQRELPAEEATHAVRVLRLKEGDEIFLMDGAGVFYQATVALASQKHCMYDIKRSFAQSPTWSGHIHLAIAPTKDMGRMEWMAEKATEVGFNELSFLQCQFSERKALRADRISRIVVSAMKQSRKAWLPVVNDLLPFKEFIAQPRAGRKFICHCYEEIERKDFYSQLLLPAGQGEVAPAEEADAASIAQAGIASAEENVTSAGQDVTVLVGPEGDFSIDEVRLAMANGYEPVTLGASRLRTETAGLYAVMMANLARRSWEM